MFGSGGGASCGCEVSDGKPETCGRGIGSCDEEDDEEDAVEFAYCLAASA